jgi:molecular chaperone DnaK
MADANKTIGRFELSDIPTAPRGVPQIEVTFDLDANGILHVSAKDMGTGKEQSIRITASSGLSEEEIENMKKDAELHAEEDKKRKEMVEAKNNADSMIHMTEKTLGELGDKVDAETKGNVEREIENTKKALESDDFDSIKSATEALTQASHKLAELMYAQASQDQGAAAGAGPDAAGADAGKASSKDDDDDVVDADFEEVK